MTDNSVEQQVPTSEAGKRLDQVAASLFPDYSRARLQQWITDGLLQVNGETVKPRLKLVGGERLKLIPEEQPQGEWTPEALPLDIIYEDEEILVLNKPAGLVVHPAAGNYTGTLLNGLLYRYPELVNLPRAGIVHRLDKDTSGLMVVARTLRSHQSLVNQLQARTVGREYLAVVYGLPPVSGQVEEPIARHPKQRQKMAVVASGKEALTYFSVESRFQRHSLLRLKLATGRTHQIRVHMTHLGYPLVGDTQYGRPPKGKKGLSDALIDAVNDFPRQALHAARLQLIHPATEIAMFWEVEVPEDMRQLIEVLCLENKTGATR